MMRLSLIAGLALASLTLVGCGGGTSSAPVAASPTATVPADPVARVVYDFLTAVKAGDVDGASKCLTPLALQKTRENDLNFCPPASPTASFEVAGVETVGPRQSVVTSIWTDLDADGSPREEVYLWALREDAGIWRISGVAAQPAGENEAMEPVVINFEDPQGSQSAEGPAEPPASNPTAPLPTDKVARDPFQQPTQR